MRESYYNRLGIIGRDVDELNVVACRLMLDIMPGLETSVVFQVLISESLFQFFFLVDLHLHSIFEFLKSFFVLYVNFSAVLYVASGIHSPNLLLM